MATFGRAVVSGVVGVFVVVSVVVGSTGVGLGTTVTPGGAAGTSRMYPGQTVPVVEFDVASEDESLQGQTPKTSVENLGSRFQSSLTYVEAFIDRNDSDSHFDSDDRIIQLSRLSSAQGINSVYGSSLRKFYTDKVYYDYSGNGLYSGQEPVFRDENEDGQLDHNDRILVPGLAPIESFQTTSDTEVFLDGGGQSTDKFDFQEPILSVNIAGRFSKGPLNQDPTKLLRNGKAPIQGFQSQNGSYKYFDDGNGGAVASFDGIEAIIFDDGDGTITTGPLSAGVDRVERSGIANLRDVQTGKYLFPDTANPTKNRYNPTEAIIRDHGTIGEIDSKDTVRKSGNANLREFSSSQSSFGAGTVKIGNSSDPFFDSGEFVFVEDGNDPHRYNPGEDVVLASKNGPTGLSTSTIGDISKSSYYDVAFLDLNGNHQLDVTPDEETNPGSEPLIEFRTIQRTGQLSGLDDGMHFLDAFSGNSATKGIAGNWFDNIAVQDLGRSTGQNQSGTIQYSDVPNAGTQGEFDSNEMLVENGGQKSILEKSDFVLRSGSLYNIKRLYDTIEYLDANRDGKFGDEDYIIDSSSPYDQYLEKQDTIISAGDGLVGHSISSRFEFIDTNQNVRFDSGETVIKSEEQGDEFLSVKDDIFMPTQSPGSVGLNHFSYSETRKEMYIDAGGDENRFDGSDIIVSTSKTFTGPIDGYQFHKIGDLTRYVDSNNNGKYETGEFVFVESDTQIDGRWGDKITAVTLRNRGTLPDDDVETVTLRQNGTAIASASNPRKGIWTLRPNATSGTFGPTGPETNFSVTATIAPSAPPGETVDFAVSAVQDAGTAGNYDAGDHGLFFADGPPDGDLTSGRRYTVGDPAGIGADGIAFPDPTRTAAASVELAFTDRVDAGTTEPGDFTVTTTDGERATVTGLADDDGDRRLVLEVNESVPPATIDGVRIATGSVAVASGASVPGQTVDVVATSATVTEAATASPGVYRGERVALLANEGGNDDEAVRIAYDSDGDGTADALRLLGATGNGSRIAVIDTGAVNTSRWRATFRSPDGTAGESVAVPVRNLSLSASTPRTNTTDVAGPIEVSVRSNAVDRPVEARLVNVSDGTTLASRRIRMNGSGMARVAFDPQIGHVAAVVRDLGTGLTNRTANVTVRVGHPAARFVDRAIVEQRGDVARVRLRLVDTRTATVTLGGEAVNFASRLPVVDRDGDGRVTIDVNTYRAGTGATGNGLSIAHGRDPRWGANETVDSGRPRDADGRSDQADVLGPVERLTPDEAGLGHPLEAGSYAMNVSTHGTVTDVGVLRIDPRATNGVRTLVAPAGVDLTSPGAVANWTTERSSIAVGDQAIVAVNASGLTGFVNESTDLRENSADAARTGASVAVTERDPPPNARARQLNVSRDPTVVDGANDTLYLVLGTDDGRVGPDDEFEAAFTLNETSPFVGGSGSDDVVERERATTTLAFAAPTGRFRNRSENGTLDLPTAADATIGGETNLAPGTAVTVAIRSTDGNVALNETDTDTVSTDGSFDGTVDLADYPSGTNYTVSATANGEAITPLLHGRLVEANATVALAVDSTEGARGAGGGGGSGGGWNDDRADRRTTTGTTANATTTEKADTSRPLPPTVAIRDRVTRFVTREVPRFVATRTTEVVLGLGGLALLVSLFGVGRLLR